MKLTVAALSPDRWPDLEAVFNARGCSVARGCWCMAYRVSGSGQHVPPGMTRSQANRVGLKAPVDSGNPPGLIGYRGKAPVGWVSVGPREDYAKLKRSPVMKAVDRQAVWSIICFVVPAAYRGQGVAKALLKGAVAYVEAGRHACRGLSGRQTRAAQRRIHVVWGEVHVRQRRLQGSCASRAPASDRGALCESANMKQEVSSERPRRASQCRRRDMNMPSPVFRSCRCPRPPL
jgi:GNAT superfamily N-acetyltransferase